MCNQSLFKWWRHLHNWQNNSQRQFEHSKFNANICKSSSPKLLDKILRYLIKIVLGYVKSKFVQTVAPPIAKDNLNIENLMQTFENLLLQKYLTKFLDITYK